MSSIHISGREMLRILRDRTKAGLDVRIVGSATRDFHARDLSRLPLHTRTIIRDGEQAFIGSQILRVEEVEKPKTVELRGATTKGRVATQAYCFA
jgi:hypothetical protein